MKNTRFRPAVAMIELIFAIVVVAIVMLSIPMIIRVMNQSQELSVGQEMFAKMYAQAQKKSMNPWDKHVSDIVLNPNDTNGTILWVGGGSIDLNCSRVVGATSYRNNPISIRACNQASLAASSISAGDANGTLGIEHYNNTDITIVDPVNGNYTAHIVVDYVDDRVNESSAGHLDVVTPWVLGTDTTPSGAGSAPSHLKRVVMRFMKVGEDTNSTFTFFMSNIGVVQ